MARYDRSGVGSEPAEKSVTAAAIQKKQNPRLLFAFAGLLTGLSLAVPAAMMVFVWPANRTRFHPANGWWEGAVWWPVVLGEIALSLACGRAGRGLAARAEPSAQQIAVGSKAGLSHSVATGVSLVLPLAIVALILGSVAYLWASALSAGVGLVWGGLAGIAVASAGLLAADPVFTQRWLRSFATVAFVLAALGIFTQSPYSCLNLHNV